MASKAPKNMDPSALLLIDNHEASPDIECNKHVLSVFGNEMLLETILHYAVHSGGSLAALNRKQLCNLRLVSKTWSNSISKLFELKGYPLYSIKLTPTNTLNIQILDQEKILNRFVKFLEATKPENCYKGFALKLHPEVFRQENHEHLVTCLRQICKHLVDFRLAVPKNGGSLPGFFPNTVNLSKLKKLFVWFSRQEIPYIPEAEQSSISSDNTTFLLQSLLFKSCNLEELNVSEEVPPHMEFMDLPSSLQNLSLELKHNNEAWQCLIRNEMPNLTKLTLGLSLHEASTTVAKTVLHQVFDKFRHNLQRLHIYEFFDHTSRRNSPYNLRFPAMEELRYLEIYGFHLELETGISSISTVLPKLCALRLDCHTAAMLQKWTASSPTPNVATVSLAPVDTQPLFPRPTPTEEMIKNVHKTFPNIASLSLCQTGTDFESLQYVFREMHQLKKLLVVAVVNDTATSPFSELWDSVLLGAPLEFLVGLKACPQFWESVKIDNKTQPCIKLLKNLEFLRLEANLDERQRSLVSDLSFLYGFNEMSNLRSVHLLGGFWASNTIREEWLKQGREILNLPATR